MEKDENHNYKQDVDYDAWFERRKKHLPHEFKDLLEYYDSHYAFCQEDGIKDLVEELLAQQWNLIDKINQLEEKYMPRLISAIRTNILDNNLDIK